jgi:hypothetical protein
MGGFVVRLVVCEYKGVHDNMPSAQDDFVNRFLDSPDTAEALAWLAGATRKKPRTLGEDETTVGSIELVEELYAAEARQVLVVEIDRYDEGENTGKLVIELPDNAQDREMLFGIAGKIAEAQGFDAEPDNGQKYLFVMLD